MAVYVRRVTWVDVSGASRTTATVGSGTMAGVQVGLASISNADYILESEGQLFSNPTPAPVAATYQNVSDQASLWFTNAAGEISTISVPAPKLSIFMADGQTVDPTSVAGVVALILAVCTDSNGSPLVAFVGGIRVQS